MAIPSCELSVDPLMPTEDLHAAVRRVCKALLKEWVDIDETAVHMSRISGGITNLFDAGRESAFRKLGNVFDKLSQTWIHLCDPCKAHLQGFGLREIVGVCELGFETIRTEFTVLDEVLSEASVGRIFEASVTRPGKQAYQIQVKGLVKDGKTEHVLHLTTFLVHKQPKAFVLCYTVGGAFGGVGPFVLKVWAEGKGVSRDTVTVRIFGANTEAVIDRNRELQALHYLSAAGFGAQLLGLFENGMVQSFISARTLSPQDISQPNLAAVIAKELRRLHDAEVPGSREPQLWVDIWKFVEEASNVSFDDVVKQKKFERISLKELREEIEGLKRSCDLLEAPLAFAHNDLLCGNLMFSDETGVLHLIDFEYSSYSYRGYDIANHFNEYAGLDCDYSLYPKKEAQYHFFRHYLQPESPTKTTETELESLYIETNVYSLASHLYWAVWAIVQARFSSIDFDYLEYFFQRYNEYKRRKIECLKLIQLKN